MAHEDKYQFWMVWNPARSAPSMIHRSARDAALEAQRLASANPGQRFYVLKGLRYTQVQAARTVELQAPPPQTVTLDDDAVPF